MYSMTGFGRASLESSDLSVDVTLRSVNGRYLDIKVFAPKIYGPVEIEIKKNLGRYFQRGTVEVFIARRAQGSQQKISFNKNLAKNWLKGFQAISGELKLSQSSQAEILLQIPEFFSVEEETSLSLQEKKKLLQTIEKAAQACHAVRQKEGDVLKKDILRQLQNLSKEIEKIKKLRTEVLEEMSRRYGDRLKKLDVSVEIDQNRLAQELLILSDKSDISEEILRLEAHLKVLVGLIKGNKSSLGKKLDFYAQELLREINTIGSKSNLANLTQAVVDSKGWIEKYREQVQNIE